MSEWTARRTYGKVSVVDPPPRLSNMLAPHDSLVPELLPGIALDDLLDPLHSVIQEVPEVDDVLPPYGELGREGGQGCVLAEHEEELGEGRVHRADRHSGGLRESDPAVVMHAAPDACPALHDGVPHLALLLPGEDENVAPAVGVAGGEEGEELAGAVQRGEGLARLRDA